MQMVQEMEITYLMNSLQTFLPMNNGKDHQVGRKSLIRLSTQMMLNTMTLMEFKIIPRVEDQKLISSIREIWVLMTSKCNMHSRDHHQDIKNLLKIQVLICLSTMLLLWLIMILIAHVVLKLELIVLVFRKGKRTKLTIRKTLLIRLIGKVLMEKEKEVMTIAMLMNFSTSLEIRMPLQLQLVK